MAMPPECSWCGAVLPPNNPLCTNCGMRQAAPTVWQEVRAILAEMSVLAEAPTGTIGATTGHAKPGSAAPRGDGAGLLDKWAGIFARETDATPERRIRMLLAFARADLERARKRPPQIHERKETGQTVEDIVRLGRGLPCAEVAAYISLDGKGNCPPSYVARVREQNDLNRFDGLERQPRQSRIARAVRLRAEGRTHQKIAAELGVDRSTVTRYLQAAREEAAA